MFVRMKAIMIWMLCATLSTGGYGNIMTDREEEQPSVHDDNAPPQEHVRLRQRPAVDDVYGGVVVGSDNNDGNLRLQSQRRAKRVKGIRPIVYPLQLCQGDCDTDADCDVGLKCFQRDKNDAVPGCEGGESFSARTDFCVLEELLDSPSSPVVVAPPPPPVNVPAPSPPSVTSRPSPIYANEALTKADFVGNGGALKGKKPLGLCQGDCDSDNDCQGEMVCFQRGGSTETPGCKNANTGSTDYCVPPVKNIVWFPPGGTSNGNTLNLCEAGCVTDDDCAGSLWCYIRAGPFMEVPGCLGGDSELSQRNVCTLMGYTQFTPNPTPAPIKPGSLQDVHIKLYWEDGYDWQERYYDLNFCMNHNYNVGLRNGCWYGRKRDDCRADQLYVSKCRGYSRQLFSIEVFDNGREGMISPAGENRCMERDGLEIFLKPCDVSKNAQRWVPINGSFSDFRFEITPKDDQSLCVTQRHHPKNAEVVELMKCRVARSPSHLTSYWETYTS